MRMLKFKKMLKKRHKSNPHKHRRHHKRHRRNPSPKLKAILQPHNFLSIAAVAGGLVGGAKLQNMVFAMPMFPASVRRFGGLLTFVAGTVITLGAKKDVVKKLGMGVSAAGIYDVFAQNIPQLALKPLGTSFDLSGKDYLVGGNVQLVGGTTIDMAGGDMTELVGEDADDRIYA